ncbi:hypothetical protein K3495_g4041 [Podosphaera aphanis]|nr:hypothetical protein K3495_g4041 [Podosphaera aphanis]
MPGVKRQFECPEKNEAQSAFLPIFEVFRDELDQHHDRRERIIKASRDITAASKKIIFALQRVRALNSDIPPRIASEIQEKKAAIIEQFKLIAPDLSGINSWRYHRQISGGLQEFIEAISLEHYLRHQSLITPREALDLLPEGIDLTGDDYILGIFDLTGELMRFAITTMATTGTLPGSRSKEGEGRDILTDLRHLRSRFESLDVTSCESTWLSNDCEKKISVMKECVHKVESAVSGMIIRGRERPKGWLPDTSGDRVVPTESY